jgi:hypothetical protein
MAAMQKEELQRACEQMELSTLLTAFDPARVEKIRAQLSGAHDALVSADGLRGRRAETR